MTRGGLIGQDEVGLIGQPEKGGLIGILDMARGLHGHGEGRTDWTGRGGTDWTDKYNRQPRTKTLISILTSTTTTVLYCTALYCAVLCSAAT